MSNNELLKIEPMYLQFPFELNKQMSCSLDLTNKTDNNVAFKVKTKNPKNYCVRSNCGLILPKSTCKVLVTMQAQKEVLNSDMQSNEKFMIQSVIASPGVTSKEVTRDTFRLGLGLDSYDWVVDNKSCNGFSSTKTWSVLRPRAEPVDWLGKVWFKGATPKHAFLMWTAQLDRLPTKVRLATWGMQLNTTCGLCSLQPETRDHLLFSCDFARFIWHAVSVRLHLPAIAFATWTDLLSWMSVKNNRSPTTLRKLVAHSVIYAIWKQRNNLHHNNVYVLPSVIFKEIDREVKNSINARRLKKRFRTLMRHWLH